MPDPERYVDSPIGLLYLAATDEGLTHLLFAAEMESAGPSAGRSRKRAAGRTARNVLDTAARQLQEYFAGRRRAFELPLAPNGTEFQLATWRELCGIPYGATISYRELARRIGRPKAVRAVGTANGRNPLSIVVPCHRVIGSDGGLTGYGGGLDAKRALLELEGVRLRGRLHAQSGGS